jgi:hypothetical protein
LRPSAALADAGAAFGHSAASGEPDQITRLHPGRGVTTPLMPKKLGTIITPEHGLLGPVPIASP